MNTSTVYGAYTGLTDEMCVCTQDLTSLQEIAISHHYLNKIMQIFKQNSSFQ